MSILLTLSGIIAISILFLGVLVYLRDKKSITNKTFFGFMISLVFWMIFSAILDFQLSKNPTIILYSARLAHASGFFMAGFYLRHCRVFPKREYKTPSWEKLLYFSGLTFVFIVLLTNLVFPGVREYKAGEVLLLSSKIDASVNYYPYLLTVIWLASVAFAAIGTLIWKLRKSKRLAKIQLQYLLLGTALFTIYVIFTNLIIGFLIKGPMITFLGPYGLVFFLGFTSYAIIKHRLMDIRLVVFKSLTYSFLILVLTSIYLVVIFFLKDPLASKFQISPNVTFILTGLLLVLGFFPIKRLIEKATDRWLYKGRYNPSLVLDKIGEITNSILLLAPLLKSLLQTLTSEMKISKMAILLEKESQTLGYNLRKLSYLKLKDLLEKNNILVTDELEEESPVKESLRKLGISLLVPLLIEQKPIGLLVLGDKKSGDAYTNEDINFLILLSHQITIAINNALSFQEVIEDKEEINKLLQEKKKWLKRKQELIAIAVHEMNTPVAAVEGFLSILIHEKLGNLPPQMKDYLKKAYLTSRESASLIKQVMEAAELKGK